jgi:hypothetical protein
MTTDDDDMGYIREMVMMMMVSDESFQLEWLRELAHEVSRGGATW